MNLKRTLTGMLAIATLLLSACGDDDNASPKEQFSFDGETVTLKDANLYLTYETEYNETHMYRDYFITDGTYVDGDGWDLDDYTDATYYIAVELGVPIEEEFGAGEFPLFDSFSDTPPNSNMSYVYFESGEDEAFVEYFVPDDLVGGDPVVVSGGTDDGETMTLKFNGTLTYYYFNGTDWVEDDVEGKFYFKGEVEDVRSSGPARVKQSERVHKGFH